MNGSREIKRIAQHSIDFPKWMENALVAGFLLCVRHPAGYWAYHFPSSSRELLEVKVMIPISELQKLKLTRLWDPVPRKEESQEVNSDLPDSKALYERRGFRRSRGPALKDTQKIQGDAATGVNVRIHLFEQHFLP